MVGPACSVSKACRADGRVNRHRMKGNTMVYRDFPTYPDERELDIHKLECELSVALLRIRALEKALGIANEFAGCNPDCQVDIRRDS